jgi:hypothetical protein
VIAIFGALRRRLFFCDLRANFAIVANKGFVLLAAVCNLFTAKFAKNSRKVH